MTAGAPLPLGRLADPPESPGFDWARGWKRVLDQYFTQLRATAAPTKIPAYTEADLPPASDYPGHIVYVAAPKHPRAGVGPNLVKSGQAFDSGDWTKVNSLTVTADAGTAPDGTATADKLLRDSAASSFHLQQQLVAGTVRGDLYLAECHFKAVELTWARLELVDAGFGVNSHAYFDLAAGTVGTIGSGLDSAGIESVGSSWYRCWIVDEAADYKDAFLRIRLAQAADDIDFPIGNATDGILAWGAACRHASRLRLSDGTNWIGI